MVQKKPGIFKSLWMQYRWDDCKNPEEISEINDPAKIFGIFKRSNKRLFTKNLVVIDIRPFELWDRYLEKECNSKLEWMEKQNLDLSIIFECEDGTRIMGLIKSNIFNSSSGLKVGNIYKVTGTFNYIKPFVEQGIFLFFRINDWKSI